MSTKRQLGALMILAAALTASASAGEARAPTFLGAYFWKQALWQYTFDAEGSTSVERGDPWGGRLVGGLGLGRFGIEARVDVTGLKEQFSFEDPETYQTLEAFALLHYIALSLDGVQLGPGAAVGTIANEQSDGISANFYGVGIRIASKGAEFHIVFAQHDYLPTGGWRFSASAHVPLYNRIYGLGDIVGGRDGYARIGVAVRLK